MKRGVCIISAALIALIAAPTTRAGGLNLATGLDASNNLISSGGVNDAHWTVTPDPTYSPTGIPQTVFPDSPDGAFFAWAANGPNSDWIARNANTSDNGPAPYTFSLTFTLTASQLASASISGAWAVDDGGELSLNGDQIATLASGAWGSLTSFSVPLGSADFVAGTNTLSITITDADQLWEAVRLEGSLSVPEPSTVTLSMIGIMVLGGSLVLRRRHVSKAA